MILGVEPGHPGDVVANPYSAFLIWRIEEPKVYGIQAVRRRLALDEFHKLVPNAIDTSGGTGEGAR